MVFVFLLILGGLAYWKTAYGVTRTWDGGGTDGTCGGAGTANNWSCAANWSADTAPTASDIATFDGTSTKNATIDANVSVAGIDINTGYTGTITQSGSFTVTVGSSHYDQADGTFTGGSGAITVSGTYTLSGGTFTSTSGTLQVGRIAPSETIFTVSGGTFNHNDGTVRFGGTIGACASGGVYIIDVATSLTLYDADIGFNYCGGGDISLASGDTIVVAHNFTHSFESFAGSWEVQGNVTIGSGAAGGEGTLTYTTAGTHTYAFAAGGSGSHLRVDNASATVSPAGGTTNLTLTRFSLLAGTFTAPTGTLQVGRTAVASETIFTVSGGTFNHNDGMVHFVGGLPSCTSGGVFTIDVVTSLTLYDVGTGFNSCGGGTISLASGDTIVATHNLTHSYESLAGSWEVQGNVTIGSGAAGGTATLAFTGGNDQSYIDQGGDEMDGDITINKPGGSVALLSSADWNAANQDLTITSGVLRAGGSAALSTGSLTVGSGGLLKMTGGGDLTLGGNVSNGGQIVIESNQTCGGADDIQILSSVSGTQRSWSGSGSVTIYDATVKDQGGSAAITAYSSTSVSGNGGNWTFSGAACPAVPPAVTIGSGTLNVRSGIMNIR